MSETPKYKVKGSFLNQTSEAFSLEVILTYLATKAFSITILAPFNFVENRFQVMGQMKRNGLISDLYKSYSECILRAVNEQNGIRALWKGNLAKILLGGSGLTFSLTAGNYGKREITKIYRQNITEDPTYSKYFGSIGGILSTFFGIVLTYPFEYAYIRLVSGKDSVTKNGVKQFRSIRHAIFSTLTQDGFRGLYRGVLTGFGAIALYRVSYYGFYDLWKNFQSKQTSIYEMFAASYMITFSASFISYPANTIRKRMMMRSLEAKKYRWSGDCVSYILKNEGFRALYRGFPMALITAISNSLLLVFYDNITRKISSHPPKV